MIRKFKFEEDIYASLSCLPTAARPERAGEMQNVSAFHAPECADVLSVSRFG